VISQPLRLWHTVRWWHLMQFWGHLWFRLYRPCPDLRPPPSLREPRAGWRPYGRTVSMIGPTRFRFLNVEQELVSAADWNRPDWPKLWLYNLHYFDDLAAEGAATRAGWHHELIRRWIAENPPGQGNGWEPYPLSLRLVNWVKWALAGNALGAEAVQSLAVQTRWLRRRLEIHLLGNHIWANAKALVFAGAFFQGEDTSVWLADGLRLLDRELREQVLCDGGHFERSPMYSSIVLEDLLDLIALARVFPDVLASWRVDTWRTIAGKMLRWLEAMSHPDGQIGFFNDCAVGIALSPAQLREQAHRLGIESQLPPMSGIIRLEPSGYVRMQKGPAFLLVDTAPVGPDDQPGHTHADTLSFELSWRGRRVFTNSGTSTYVADRQRLWERSTAAHNTVTVDGENSSEVWGGFRVGRRARPFDVRCGESNEQLTLEASHDGYNWLSGRPVQRRQIVLGDGELRIRDEVVGSGAHDVVGYLHLHPDVQAARVAENAIRLSAPGVKMMLSSEDGALTVEQGYYCPEFGKRLPRAVIVWRRSGPLPIEFEVRIAEAA
jgi:uncharacterized heparinase superfamily protein